MDNSLKWVLSNIESGQTTSNAGLNQEEGCPWLIRPIEICPYRLFFFLYFIVFFRFTFNKKKKLQQYKVNKIVQGQ